MREYKFRGRAITGIWVYGGIAVKQHGTFINNEDMPYDDCCRVIPETVGQYTSLKDCKRTEQYPEGQEIFEGDIIEWSIYPDDGKCRVFDIVGFSGGCFRTEKRYNLLNSLMAPHRELCVIGNIYDNPELLKGE